jgi:hypothetical protein
MSKESVKPVNELQKYYQELENQLRPYTNYCDTVSYITREMDIIKKTLDLLNIKMEGINLE